MRTSLTFSATYPRTTPKRQTVSPAPSAIPRSRARSRSRIGLVPSQLFMAIPRDSLHHPKFRAAASRVHSHFLINRDNRSRLQSGPLSFGCERPDRLLDDSILQGMEADDRQPPPVVKKPRGVRQGLSQG